MSFPPVPPSQDPQTRPSIPLQGDQTRPSILPPPQYIPIPQRKPWYRHPLGITALAITGVLLISCCICATPPFLAGFTRGFQTSRDATSAPTPTIAPTATLAPTPTPTPQPKSWQLTNTFKGDYALGGFTEPFHLTGLWKVHWQCLGDLTDPGAFSAGLFRPDGTPMHEVPFYTTCDKQPQGDSNVLMVVDSGTYVFKVFAYEKWQIDLYQVV